MNRLAWICCLPMIGCAGSVVGEWEGDCNFTVDGQLLTYAVDIEIDDVVKDEINGTGSVVFNDEISSGVLDGTRDGDDITLEIDLGDGISFDMEGEVSGREITADFSMGGHTGDCELELDD